jgi:hypothetical protein
MRDLFSKRRLLLLALVAVLILASSTLGLTRNMALTRSSPPDSAPDGTGNASYDLSWNTVDGGGVMLSTGGNFRLSGTVGQSDAGDLAGGAYTLAGGFWNVRVLLPYRAYQPIVLRND